MEIFIKPECMCLHLCVQAHMPAGVWTHSCGYVSVCMCVPACLPVYLEASLKGEGEQLSLPIKQQQTNNHCSGPHLAVPHPSINLISPGRLTQKMCCAVLPKQSPQIALMPSTHCSHVYLWACSCQLHTCTQICRM